MGKEKEVVYVVTREGIYRHEILGVCSNLKKAERLREEVLIEEPDGYHEIAMGSIPLNTKVEDVLRIDAKKRITAMEKLREKLKVIKAPPKVCYRKPKKERR